MGAGYSYLGVPESVFKDYLGLNPECILTTLKDDDGFITFNENSLKSFLSLDSISVGMGMGDNEETFKVISYLIKNFKGNLIIDADGLNALSKFGTDVLREKSCNIILTRHVGEFCRLINGKKDAIMPDIIANVKEFSKEFGVITLLKNSVSIITDGKEVYINTTGNSALAKAGSGDVLSGIISGVTARNTDILGAVISSAYIFGKASEIAVNEQNEYTVTAMDVIKCLPKAIDNLF
jgi:NAD(P)H-hydrate epimerase